MRKEEMAKPVVLITGASGNIGLATVSALSAKHSLQIDIRAGVRNPDKADKLKTLPGVTVVRAVMGDKEQLAGVLKGVDVLYIIPPPIQGRVAIAVDTAEAAKTAGVKHVALVSVTLVGPGTDAIIAKQFEEIEGSISKLGLQYTFIRLPSFIENYFGFKGGIVAQDSIFSPVNPDQPHAPIVSADAGKFSAVILANPTQHANKIYNVHSNRHSHADFARELSTALGREIKFIRLPYEATRKNYLEMGMSEWRVNGILEAMKILDEGAPAFNPPDISTFEKITGEQGTDLNTWVASVAPAFK